jgi:preprotein translocase subunit Sec61beta
MRSLLFLAIAATLVGASVPSPARAAEPAAKDKAASKAKIESPADPEQALRARVKGYWDARVTRSNDVFGFYLPPEKGGTTGGEIGDRGSVIYEKYEIKGVKIDGDEAIVDIQAQVNVVVPNARAVFPEQLKHPQLKDAWHRADGVWYRKPVEAGLAQFWNRAGHPAEAQTNTDVPAAAAAEAGKK